MADMLKNLRAFARGQINESELEFDPDIDDDDDELDLENDDEFVSEVLEECIGVMLSMAVLGETAGNIDEATQEAFEKVTQYLAAQGVISESAAATITTKNPKVSFVRLSLKDQLARLKSMIVLKLARKADSKFFKKYKIGQKIKKENMAKMQEKYGGLADRLSKRLFRALRKRGKVAAIVDDSKEKHGLKKSA